MPNYTLQVGPLQLITGAASQGDTVQSWGQLTISNGAGDNPVFELNTPGSPDPVGGSLIQPLDSTNGQFVVTFTWRLASEQVTLVLNGTIVSDSLVSGQATVTTTSGGTKNVGFAARQLPIGPLQLVTEGRSESWGLFTLSYDATGQPQFALKPSDTSFIVTVTAQQQLDADGSFGVTFNLSNSSGSYTLALTGTVSLNLPITGTGTVTENTSLTGTWQAQLLPIAVQIRTHGSASVTIAIDGDGNLSYTPSSPGANSVPLCSVSELLDVTTGILSRVMFPAGVTLQIGSENYQWISGRFSNSVSGSGTIGPHLSGMRQQGDDTWTPIGQN